VIKNNAANPLHHAVQQLTEWSSKWQLEMNYSKCKSLHLGKNNPGLVYVVSSSPIESEEHVRDLGVEVDDCLRFDHHIQNIIKKAYQRLGVLFRGFVSKDAKLMTRAYTTYIRPLLEYCSEIWSPHLIKDIDAIESVQRYFTRRISNLKQFSYTERLFILNLESLEARRLKQDIVMCFKILHKLVDLDTDTFFSLSDLNTRGHSLKIKKPPAVKNNSLQNLFQSRVVNCWNWLPEKIVNSESINLFRKGLNTCDFNNFLKGRTLVG
jgi:hypothetical protein